MISKPESFEEYILKYSGLEEKESGKILKPVQKLITDSCYCADPLYRFNNQPDITTGFKTFDRIKTEQVISFFAQCLQPFKTKLNKLLFYKDFARLKKSASEIADISHREAAWKDNKDEKMIIPFTYAFGLETV